jgi:3-deoxy-D-arabino-heptulosonate 7-phosphate (DAHP) synthase
MVDEIVPILKPYKVASKEIKRRTVGDPIGGGQSIGGRKFGVIAGPCSVENEKQLMKTAQGCCGKAGAVGCAAARSSRAPVPTNSRAWAKRV